MKRAPGGRRKGAGRKPTAATLAKKVAQQKGAKDAEYALKLHVRTMKNAKADLKLRLACAEVVMDRVWGKPRLTMAEGNTLNLVVVDE